MKRGIETRREQAELFADGVRAYKQFCRMVDAQKNAATVTPIPPLAGLEQMQRDHAAWAESMRQEFMVRHGSCGTLSELQRGMNNPARAQRDPAAYGDNQKRARLIPYAAGSGDAYTYATGLDGQRG